MSACMCAGCGSLCACAYPCVCVCVLTENTQSGRLNRPQVLQLANGILPTQGGLWRREAKTEAALLAKLYCGWPPSCMHPLSYDPHFI